ncbi:MAG: antA/AntB antirepressor family protein [Lachnospiraceae bacterium]|nr:antA/AntB antirepressor family protein [Lachnospiraceae bacterium]
MNEVINAANQTPIEIALQIDDEGFTTARKLYEWLELDSSHYSRWCKANIVENEFAEEGKDYSPCVANKGRGNFAQDYKLYVTLAKKIAMASHCEKGNKARDYFIGCEQVLIKLAEQRHKTELERAKGIAVRQALTKAIQQSNENDRMHGYAYSTYTSVIYKAIFGKSVNQLREEFGISKKDNLRDCFSTEELQHIQSAEMLVSSLLNCGWGYDQIKDFVMKNVPRQLAV